MGKQNKARRQTPDVRKTDEMIGTVMGTGRWPWGPGTAGAAVGLLLWCALAYTVSDYLMVTAITMVATIVVTFVSIKPITRLEQSWGSDPSKVVVDETVGVWVALLAVPASREWYYAVLAFLLFRVMDIVKPLGCRWLDRNIHGGLGVMLDDVLAGIYAGLVLMVIHVIL